MQHQFLFAHIDVSSQFSKWKELKKLQDDPRGLDLAHVLGGVVSLLFLAKRKPLPDQDIHVGSHCYVPSPNPVVLFTWTDELAGNDIRYSAINFTCPYD